MDGHPSIKLVNVLVRSSKIWYFLIQSSTPFVAVALFSLFLSHSIRAFFCIVNGMKICVVISAYVIMVYCICDNNSIIIISISLVLIGNSSSDGSSRIWFGYWCRLTMELSLNEWLLPATKCKKVNSSRSNFNIQSQSSVSLLLSFVFFFKSFQPNISTHCKLKIITESVFSV